METDLDPEMGFVEDGDPAIRALADAEAGAGEVIAVIGDFVAIKPIVYGTAAGTPGTVAPTEFNFVAIAWGNIAGTDDVASAEEIVTLGYTLAHETGHYLGVPHPVETDWVSRDALEDTEECASSAECESYLGTNLMYPIALSQGGQEDLTPDQVAVLQRYVGVLD